MKKYVNKVKFFQKKMKYKRYFVLDHNARKMRIHQTNDPHSEYKLLLYTDIKTILVDPIKLSDKMAIQERWSFKFELITTARNYILYAPSGDEKELWYHTFKWICECNAFEKYLDSNKNVQKTLEKTLKDLSEEKPRTNKDKSKEETKEKNQPRRGLSQ